MQVRICYYETWQRMWAHTHKSWWIYELSENDPLLQTPVFREVLWVMLFCWPSVQQFLCNVMWRNDKCLQRRESEINPICGHWAAGQHVFNCVRDVEVLSLCQWKMYHTDLWGPVGNFILSCGVHCLFDSFWFNIIAIGKWYDNLMWSCTVSSVNRAITTTDGDKSPPIIIHCQIVHPIFDIDAALFVVNITKSFKSYTYKMIEFS